MPTDAPSIRESIESAMNAQAEAPEEVIEAPAVEEVPALPDEAPKPAAADRARDETGRFAKAEKAAEKPAAAPKGAEKAGTGKTAAEGQGTAAGVSTAQPGPTAPAAPPAPLKVPQSWKPHVRELAAKLPAEFHPLIEESLRRDGEVTRALQETAEARRTAETVQKTLAPFEGVARASGMDVMSYAGSVMQTAAMLFQGPPGNRAALIAQLIKQAGVNPEDVNPYLAGERAAPAPQSQPQPNIDEIVERRLTEREQRAEAERNRQAVEEFKATEPEFFDDVWQDMVSVLETAKKTGRNLTLQQAYDRACRMNEDVAKVLDSRKVAEAARAQAPTVQRSKVAASSVKPSAAAATPRASGTPSLRETIEAAVAGQRT